MTEGPDQPDEQAPPHHLPALLDGEPLDGGEAAETAGGNSPP